MPILEKVSKSVCFLILNNFFKNGSPGQTTMLMRRGAKFWVEPWSPFSYISHHDPKTLGKPLIIVSWPECRPEFPSDGGDDGDGFPRTLSIWLEPWSNVPRDQISRSGNPSLRQSETIKSMFKNLCEINKMLCDLVWTSAQDDLALT